MAEIWRKDDGKWSTIGPSGFVNEAELHQQIVEAPELLPIAGQRRIVAPFSEVGLGGGKADVLAFTDMGRPVVIEVKLKRNNEAKRAVVAQTLGYAAQLHGVTVEKLEEDILAQPQHLGGRKLADIIEETDANIIDRDEFYENLAKHLAEGSFRLVIVLDEASEYLVRLMGYLETITTDRISIDLVTVSAYEVNRAQILVPQRIDPEREPEREVAQLHRPQRRYGRGSRQGADRFREWVDGIDDAEQAAVLLRVVDWADGLVEEGVCQVQNTVREPGEMGPRMGLTVHALNRQRLAILDTAPKSGEPQLWLRGPIIAEYAPDSLLAVQQASGQPLDKEGHANAITDELLDALADAYREVAEGIGRISDGSAHFRTTISRAADANQATRLQQLADWAEALAAEGLCNLYSFEGATQTTLLPRLKSERKAGLCYAVHTQSGKVRLWLTDTVIRRHVSKTLPALQDAAGREIGNSRGYSEPTHELLDALADAYREAAGTA